MYRCINDRFDSDGEYLFENLEDFFQMCRDCGWGTPNVYLDGIWWRESITGDKILEEVE